MSNSRQQTFFCFSVGPSLNLIISMLHSTPDLSHLRLRSSTNLITFFTQVSQQEKAVPRDCTPCKIAIGCAT